MVITREWSMPNSLTFSIKPINQFIHRHIKNCKDIIDPFCRNSPFKLISLCNDLDPDIEAHYHMDALDFLKMQPDNKFDCVLFDPPYTLRQVSEVYKKTGRSVNSETTTAAFWSNIKAEIQRITCDNAIAITCGYNSGGVGEKYGFKIDEILLVAHGGAHNDTIVVKETKRVEVQNKLCLF